MKNRCRFFVGMAGLIGLFFFLAISSGYAQESQLSNSVEGFWQTVPDDEGSPSVVHIWVENGQAFGKVVRIYPKPGKDPDPICDKCIGELQNKPIIGMTILSDLAPDNDKWSGGTILDPNNGKIYKCKIEVVEDGAKLKVRGFVGFSMLGRTQYWLSVPKPQ